ncbi:hypothetical protein QWZ01_05640 [Mucilaginibacter aquaedulcis]|nr:hypothetical protein [Mucilaginibacter aquaedulcis]MDN3547843.1 hypothetical protein [Mucilaginibacter aquaedulcis]
MLATRALKHAEALKHIPVIYFSANSEIESLMEEAGADSYLAKPFDLADLDHIIKVVLSKI